MSYYYTQKTVCVYWKSSVIYSFIEQKKKHFECFHHHDDHHHELHMSYSCVKCFLLLCIYTAVDHFDFMRSSTYAVQSSLPIKRRKKTRTYTHTSTTTHAIVSLSAERFTSIFIQRMTPKTHCAINFQCK